MEGKVDKEEEEKATITVEHNEDVFNIDFDCASKQDSSPNEREDEDKEYRKIAVVPDDESEEKEMDISKDKYKSIETIFKKWS